MIAIFLFLFSCGGLSVDYRIDEVDSDTEIVDTDILDTDVIITDTDTEVIDTAIIDTSTTDTGITQITPTGLIGGVFRFSRLEVPCQECFYEYTSSIRITSVLALHPPTQRSWNEWIPPAGTCQNFVSQTDPATQFYNVGTSIDISDGFQTNSLARVYNAGQPEYRFESGYPNDFSLYNFYDVQVYQNSSLGEFYIPDALHTPDQIFLLSPTEILNPYNTAFPPAVRRSGTAFAWEPGGDGLFFIITDVYDSSGYYYLGGSLCVGEDTGSLYVSGLSSFPAGSLLAIYMYRYEITETIIPPNGSTLEGVGQVGLVGTATLAN